MEGFRTDLGRGLLIGIVGIAGAPTNSLPTTPPTQVEVLEDPRENEAPHLEPGLPVAPLQNRERVPGRGY